MSGNLLYAASLKQRERAARKFTVFANGGPPPRAWRREWEEVLGGQDPRTGASWPDELRQGCNEKRWPQHAFGTANAGVLVLWNRPRTAVTTHTKETPHWTDPRTPVLGGIPHTQIAGWEPGPAGVGWIRSWVLLRHYLHLALQPFGLRNPLSAVMVTVLNPTFGVTGQSDHRANVDALLAGGRIDHIVQTVRPLLVLACGGPVRKAIASAGWEPAFGELRSADHPTSWEGYGSGRRDGDDLIAPMFAEWARIGRIPETSTSH